MNKTVQENALLGNPQNEWDVRPGDVGVGTAMENDAIQGFATDISVNLGRR